MSARSLVAALVICGFLSCSAEPPDSPGAPDAPEAADTSERFVSAYADGRKRNWLPEATTKIIPQAAPMMLIYEVSQYGRGETPNRDQLLAAHVLEASVVNAARKHGWYDFQKALNDGFRLMFGDEVHYAKQENILDDRLLDPDRPEFLMYYDTPTGKKLVGFMFYTRSMQERGPQIAGPLTVWHYHTWNRSICLLGGLLATALPDANGRCKVGVASRRSPEMIHVWLIDHPLGRFTTTMKLPPKMVERLTLKPSYLERVASSKH